MDAVMELEIEPGPEPGSYVVHVLRSVGGGEPSETITLDLDGLVDRRPTWRRECWRRRSPHAGCMSDTEAAVQDVGRRLFDVSVHRRESAPPIARAWPSHRTRKQSADRAAARPPRARRAAVGGAVRPGDADLPVPQGAVRAARARALLPAALALRRPLRVLGMISSPHGLPRSTSRPNAPGSRRRCGPHLDSRPRGAPLARGCLLGRLHGQAARGEWHVLHFIGHGAYDTDTDEGVLAFVGRDGRADYVAASSARRSARRGRAHAAAGRAELVRVGRGRHLRPVLGHGCGAHAQRHPRGGRDAVLDQRRRGESRSLAASTRRWRIAGASTRPCAAATSAYSASDAARSSGSRPCSTSAARTRTCSTWRPCRPLRRHSRRMEPDVVAAPIPIITGITDAVPPPRAQTEPTSTPVATPASTASPTGTQPIDAARAAPLGTVPKPGPSAPPSGPTDAVAPVLHRPAPRPRAGRPAVPRQDPRRRVPRRGTRRGSARRERRVDRGRHRRRRRDRWRRLGSPSAGARRRRRRVGRFPGARRNSPLRWTPHGRTSASTASRATSS